jgi:hypothetical protein
LKIYKKWDCVSLHWYWLFWVRVRVQSNLAMLMDKLNLILKNTQNENCIWIWNLS